MQNNKRIVLLGAGYGGVLTAKKLARKLRKEHDVEIIIIDKKPYHTMLTELHEVAANRVPEDSIKIFLSKIFAKRKVKVVLDEIKDIDFKNKVLKSDSKSYEYDYLVIGTGSRPTYFNTPGAEEFAKKLWSYEEAVDLKAHILDVFRKATCETDPIKRQKLLTFVVIGAGFTGIEMIGELAEWKNRLCIDFHIDKKDVKLYVVDALKRVLPILPENLSIKAERRLRRLGVEIITDACITEVTKDSIRYCDKDEIKASTIVWAAGVEGADIVGKLDLQQKGRKRIQTNDKLQSVDYNNVYVVGDNIFYIPEGDDKPVPQMVENAEHASSTVAHNLCSDIKGGEKKSYKPHFHGTMVSIGGRYGVAHVGMPGKFFAVSGFIAMFIKHFINVVYFFQVEGFNKVWSYMMHEFFHIKDRRSIVGGHLSKASPNFWLVILRLFLGYKWLAEGIDKVGKVIADPTKIFLIPAKAAATATQANPDAVTGASEKVGEAATQWGQAIPVPEFISNIVKWSMDTFFYTSNGGYTPLAYIFQTGMILAEVVIGLMLIAGLFTALASVVSIAMGVMIWTSGMAPLEMIWYMVAAIALIGGAGSVFGLDYYVLPFLKRYWKKIGFVKKYYLYTD